MKKALLGLVLLAGLSLGAARPAAAGVSVAIGLPGFGLFVGAPYPPVAYAAPPVIYPAVPAYYGYGYRYPYYRPYYGYAGYGGYGRYYGYGYRGCHHW